MIQMCLKGLLVGFRVFRVYFVDILQVKGKYLENVKNWVLSVEYLRGKVSRKCMKGNKRVTLGPEMFRYWGIIDSGALSWKSQRSRRTGQIGAGQVGIEKLKLAYVKQQQVKSRQRVSLFYR